MLRHTLKLSVLKSINYEIKKYFADLLIEDELTLKTLTDLNDTLAESARELETIYIRISTYGDPDDKKQIESINKLTIKIREKMADDLEKTSNRLKQNLEDPLTKKNLEEMIEKISMFQKDLAILEEYFERLDSIKNPNRSHNLLLGIEFNLFKKEELKITYYYDDDNTFDDAFYEELKKVLPQNQYIKSLKIFSGSFKITDHHVAQIIEGANNLQSLTIVSDDITDQSAEMLLPCQLRELCLAGDKLTNQSAHYLASHPTLTQITLTGKEIKIGGFLELLSNKNLIELQINSDSITDDDIPALTEALKSSAIKKLAIRSQSLSNQSIPLLAEIANLEEILLDSYHFNDQTAAFFANNPSLAKLYIEGNAFLTHPGLQYFAHQADDLHPNKLAYKNYLLSLGNNAFLKQSIKTLEIAQLISQDADLKNKLNQVHENMDQQTYPHSCSARAIMLMLNKFNKLTDEEIHRAKELEIYTEIWKKPGDDADIDRIVAYLHKHNLHAVIHEDKDSLEKLSRSNSKFEKEYQNYCAKSKELTIKNRDILQKKWKKDNYFMITVVEREPVMGLHMLILACENKTLHLLNPGPGTQKTSDSLQALLEQETLSGVCIQVKSDQPMSHLQKSRSGFFTFHQPSQDDQEESQKKSCYIQ